MSMRYTIEIKMADGKWHELTTFGRTFRSDNPQWIAEKLTHFTIDCGWLVRRAPAKKYEDNK